MKNFVTLILLLLSTIVFSQNQDNGKRIESIINKEFKSKNSKNLIVISDNLDNILIVSESKLVKVYKNKKDCFKKKVRRLNKKEREYFKLCIQNSNFLKSFKNKKCPERIRRCRNLTYYYYSKGNLEFSNSFFADFDDLKKKDKIDYLLNLYNDSF